VTKRLFNQCLCCLLFLSFNAASKEYLIILKDHLFYPSQIIIPANKKVKLLIENQDKIKSGELKEDMLSLESFNPEFDTRLHQYYSNRIKRAFDPNYQTAQEVRKAEELKSRIKTENKDNV